MLNSEICTLRHQFENVKQTMHNIENRLEQLECIPVEDANTGDNPSFCDFLANQNSPDVENGDL